MNCRDAVNDSYHSMKLFSETVLRVCAVGQSLDSDPR